MSQLQDFKLYNAYVKFDRYLRSNILNNIPSVHRGDRIHLEDESYNLLNYLLEAEYNTGNIRNKNINEMIITIIKIQYLFSILRDTNIKNKIDTCSNYLLVIKDMTYKWKISIDEKVCR